ncbi:unnamed protein product [Mucor hiemalis]
MATRKRKLAEVNSSNARIDSFYKPVPKDSLKKPLVFNDENDTKQPSVSPLGSQEKNTLDRKVFGDSSNRKPFGDVGNKTFGEKNSVLKPKVLCEQKQFMSNSVRQPLGEKSTANSLKLSEVIKPNKSEPEFKVLRDPEDETSQSQNLTSSPLDVYGDSEEEEEEEEKVDTNNNLYVYDENKHTTTSSQENEVQSPLVVYKDEDSPLAIYKDDNSNHSSPLAVYRDNNSNQSSPLLVYKDESSNHNSPLVIYNDKEDNCDSPLVIYNDEAETIDSPLLIYKDENVDDSPLAVYRDESVDPPPLAIFKDNDSSLRICKGEDSSFRMPLAEKYNENEDEDEPPFIIFKDSFTVAKDGEEDENVEDSLGKMITADTQEDKKLKVRSFLDNNTQPKELKRSSKSLLFSDNYDELGTTIDSSKDFFDEEEEDDQHDYADVVDSFYNDEFSVTNNTISQESIESTPAPAILKSSLPPPKSVLGSKTFFSKYGSKK